MVLGAAARRAAVGKNAEEETFVKEPLDTCLLVQDVLLSNRGL